MPEPPGPSNRLGEVLRTVHSPIAVSHDDRRSDDEISADIGAGADVIELRIDRFSDASADHVVAEARRRHTVPLLATVRLPDDGGHWTGSEVDRAALLTTLIPHVDAVDVELAHTDSMREVVAAARANNCLVVVSSHEMDHTPTQALLDDLVDSARSAGADIVKVATMVRDSGDLKRLAGLLLRQPRADLVVIGMGEQGSVSRVAFPALGSVLTFASSGPAAQRAPGQLDLAEAVEMRGRFYATPR